MVDSSLIYEILMYLNSFYFGMFATCEIGMGSLKFVNLPYENESDMYKEGIILVGLCTLEFFRIYLGKQGSLSDHGYKVWLSVFLTIPVAMGVIFLLFFQVHKLRLEYTLCALMLSLLLTEMVFAVLFLFSLCKQPTYE